MLIYGANPVREAIRANPDRIRVVVVASSHRSRLQELISEAKEAGVGIKILAPQQIDRLAHGKTHNGVLAEMNEVTYTDFDDAIAHEETRFVLLLDSIQDPQNLGAILRVADGFGVDLVVIPEHDSAGLTPAAVKASAGASEWIPVAQVVNLSRAIERLKEKEFWVYGADGSGDPLDQFDMKGKVAIVMGNEGKGIRRNVMEHCDRLVAIPTVGKLESLNVATATAVIAYEVRRQNR
jgi:23S rRNA (guanosine2251-2'-O)-methyltransferase